MYTLKDSALAPNSSIPNIKQLREQYTYNIYPCVSVVAVEQSGVGRNDGCRQCPQPSRGGSFLPISVSPRHTPERSLKRLDEGEKGEGDLRTLPLDCQIKKLSEHYASIARQPIVSCDVMLAVPRAKVVCPQTWDSVFPLGHSAPYAADVPNSVLQRSKALCHSSTLEFVQQHCRSSFTLQSLPERGTPPQAGHSSHLYV